MRKKKMYRNGIKRIIDFILALCGLIILSPVFLILCVWIKADSRGPILFKQKRIGVNKSYFNIYKFRTMYIDTPKDMPTHMLKDPDQFITKAGKFLRKTSLEGVDIIGQSTEALILKGVRLISPNHIVVNAGWGCARTPIRI